MLWTLLRRDGEAPSWAWVAGGFVPVSQLLPWLCPMADRYLYTILPGLVGAGLVAAQYPNGIPAQLMRAQNAARGGGSRNGAPTP